MATSESLFCVNYFGEASGGKVFDRCMRSAGRWLQDTLRKSLTGSADGISMLLLVALNAELQKSSAAKGVHKLDSYFDLTNITLWPMFKKVLDAHLDSLKNVDVALIWKGTGHVEPHQVTERFAQFSFSMVSVEKNEMSEQMMAQNMATFRNGMAGWLKRIAELFTNAREKRTFLINNIHHILAGYEDGGLIEGDDFDFWEVWRSTQVSQAVNEALSPSTHAVLGGFEKHFSVQDADDEAGKTHWSDMGGELEQMVHDFAKDWQAALKAVADALARDFDWSTSLLHYVSQSAFDRLMERFDRYDHACNHAGLHKSRTSPSQSANLLVISRSSSTACYTVYTSHFGARLALSDSLRVVADRDEIVTTRDLHFEIKKYIKTPDLRASMHAPGGS